MRNSRLNRLQFLQQPVWSIGITWLLLLLHAWYFWPFLSDDSLISLRYADRLVDGLGLTWTSGQPVEGYTNFSWVILHAGLHALGIDLIVACRLLSVSVMLGLAAVLLQYPARSLIGTILMIVLLSSAPFAIWAIGGLEAGLFAFLIATSLNLCGKIIRENQPRDWWCLSIQLALLCLTRPEGPLICVALFLGILIARHSPGRSWMKEAVAQWKMAVVPLFLYGALLVFRLWYYGEWVPNTAFVRMAPGVLYLKRGIRYMLDMLAFLAPWVILIWPYLREQMSSQRRSSHFWPLLVLSLVWLLYLLVIGGDYFPGYRLGLPLLVCLAVLFRETKSFFLFTPKWSTPWAILMLVVAFAGGQWLRPELGAAKEERWEWDLQVLSYALMEEYGEYDPLVAVTAAGAIPYWTGFESMDLYGLNDYHIARHRPADFGLRDIGHGLSDPEYVISRQPDIVVFFWGEKAPIDGPGRDLLALPEFNAQYHPRELSGTNPYPYTGTIWVRNEFEESINRDP